MISGTNYPTHSDTDPQIQELVRFEELTVAECPPNLNKMMFVEAGTQYDLSDICCEEAVVEKVFSPKMSEEMSNNEDREQSSSCLMTPADILNEIADFVCPPKLKKKSVKKRGKEEYDSDDTIDEYVECGEKGLCKCQKVRNKQYYEYYTRNKERELYTMYPQGKCILPKGAVLHFTGAPANMKREHVNEALTALGAKVVFTDYQNGSNEGWARLSFSQEARKIIKKMIDKKLNIAGADLIFKVLSGKDEKRYHEKVIEAIYQLQVTSKGLEKKLRKAGYKYVKKYDPNNTD
ncbi:hypothetical protein PYW07_000797 [Mythimna separata]|uniref:XRRM domain-containing protein n=1 Tax=Mythimna separata TaxID=271217 RepID=A0AAD8DVB8_MYTSE|nr:hypothetical protein PYW07_000797 [Mythimna separata]